MMDVKEMLEMFTNMQKERDVAHQTQIKELIETFQKQQIIQVGDEQQLQVGGDSVSRKIKDFADSMLPFEYSPEENVIFETWYDRYESVFAAESNDLSTPMKIRLLLMKFSQPDYQRFANTLLPQKPHELQFDDIIVKLKRLFGYKQTKFSLRHKCFGLVKSDAEDFAQYSARINKQAEKFDVKSCSPDDFKVLLFVSGLKSSQDSLILEKLLAKVDSQYVQLESQADQASIETFKKLTLQDLVNEAERIICLKRDKNVVGEPNCSSEVRAVRQKNPKTTTHRPSSNRLSPTPNNFSNSSSQQPPDCPGCEGKHFMNQCPFKASECNECHTSGHKNGYCKSMLDHYQKRRLNSRFNRDKQRNSESVETKQVCEINSVSQRKYLEPNINGATVKLQFETGSDITIISRRNWNRLGKPNLQPTTKRAGSASGDTVPLLGYFPCAIKLNNEEQFNECYVFTLDLNLFGIPWISAFKLWTVPINTFCNKVQTYSENDLATRARKKFPLLFAEGLGCCTKAKASLTLKSDAKPVYRNARPVPHAAAPAIKTELERLQRLGVLTPTDYATSAAPIVAVKKKNGKILVSTTTWNQTSIRYRHPKVSSQT